MTLKKKKNTGNSVNLQAVQILPNSTKEEKKNRTIIPSLSMHLANWASQVDQDQVGKESAC